MNIVNYGEPDWVRDTQRTGFFNMFTYKSLEPIGARQTQWVNMRTPIPQVEAKPYPSMFPGVGAMDWTGTSLENPFTNIRREVQQDINNWRRELPSILQPNAGASSITKFLADNQQTILLGAVALLGIALVSGRR